MDEKLIKHIMDKLDDISGAALESKNNKKDRYVGKTIDYRGETTEILSREKYLESLIDVIIQDLYNLSEEIYLTTGILGKDG